KKKIEEEKNEEIKRLLTELEELRNQKLEKELEEENKQETKKEETSTKLKEVESDLIKIITAYKSAINDLMTNKDIFLRNTIIDKIILSLQLKYGEMINTAQEQKFLDKLKILDSEIEYNKKEIKSLKDNINEQQEIISKYKEKLRMALDKMKEMIKFGEEKSKQEKELRKKLASERAQFNNEIAAAQHKLNEETKKRNFFQHSTINIKIFLENLINNEDKDFISNVLPQDIMELLNEAQKKIKKSNTGSVYENKKSISQKKA
ncbi:MAG: hypothetical protein MJ252_14790, partial [archaeon]|nr:hypothetical protein [archaeon]